MLFVFSWFCLDGLGLSEGLKFNRESSSPRACYVAAIGNVDWSTRSGLLELSFNKKFFDDFIHNKPPITYLF